ncbi:MAG: glutathione S-transferase [Robiginitomaculum sp.]|nr:glutathione S-transferase [Robiginitomaculum sp.]
MTNSAHILYSFRRCPYAMRARLGLKIAKIAYEHREVILRDKPAEMLHASPKGSVPVLVLQDGTVIDESLDIMLWALGKHDPENWLVPDMDEMLGLIKTLQGSFVDHLNRYKYASRYSTGTARATIDLAHRAKACEILQDFERSLNKAPYLMGSAPSLADYAIFPFIRQFSAVEKNWWDEPQFPNLHAWLSYFLDGKLFTAIMEKHPLFVSNTH